MAKFLLVALAFTTLVAFAEVSAHRNIVTTTVDEEENPWGRGSQQECRQQVQRQQLNHCQMYLSIPWSRYGDVLEMAVENPRQQEQEHLQQCCRQLRNVDEQCQCEAVQEAFRQATQQQQQGRREQQETRQMQQRAQNLPRECNLETQQCQVRGPWF